MNNISCSLADERRQLEIDLAEKTRISNDIQRQHEQYIQQETHRDGVLSTYTNEVGTLLKETNGSLTNDPIIHVIVRTKTLHVLRQLNSIRAGQVFQFLLDARQLTNNKNPLDLSTALFNNIDCNHYNLQGISLRGVNLSHALFNYALLNETNLSKTILHYTDFNKASIQKTDFDRADIEEANFTESHIRKTHFDFPSIRHSDFSSAEIHSTTFSHMSLVNTTFVKALIQYIDFDSTNLTKVIFDSNSIHQYGFIKSMLISAIPSSTMFLSTHLNFAMSRL